MSHNFTTVALPCFRRSVRAEAHVRARIIPLALLTPNNKHFIWFSPGTIHSSASILTLTLRTHTITTVHTTQSHNSTPSLTKTSVCVCLKNNSKDPSQQVGGLYTEICGFLSGLNIGTSLLGQRSNWYIIRAF